MTTFQPKHLFTTQKQIENKTQSTFKTESLDIDKLLPNPSQPRFVFNDEPLLRLADSIRKYGLLQPLSVRRNHTNDSYQIIAGERRWRACKIIGLKSVPCIILEADSQKSAELALIENIHREDLNMFEQAVAISSLIDIYGITQEVAARHLSTSQSYIANKLRILRLTPKERSEIIKHNLTERHARALLKIDDVDLRLDVIQVIVSRELNVSATEKYIEKLKEKENKPKPSIETKGQLKDIRFFYNSIDKAIELLKSCGIDVSAEKNERFGQTDIIIKILHN